MQGMHLACQMFQQHVHIVTRLVNKRCTFICGPFKYFCQSTMCHIARAMCHVARAMCHVARAMCRVARAMCHVARAMCHVARAMCSVARAMCRVVRARAQQYEMCKYTKHVRVLPTAIQLIRDGPFDCPNTPVLAGPEHQSVHQRVVHVAYVLVGGNAPPADHAVAPAHVQSDCALVRHPELALERRYAVLQDSVGPVPLTCTLGIIVCLFTCVCERHQKHTRHKLRRADTDMREQVWHKTAMQAAPGQK
jgi:hypothetical protein